MRLSNISPSFQNNIFKASFFNLTKTFQCGDTYRRKVYKR